MSKKKNGTPRTEKADSKRKYSTAKERVLNNLETMQRSAGLVRSRFSAWAKSGSEGDKSVAKIVTHLATLDGIDQEIAELHDELHKLFESFDPPKVVKKLIFEEGDTVKIAAKFRKRYAVAYANADLDALTIEKITVEKDFIVTDAQGLKFMVPAKAHLAPSKEEQAAD